MSNGSGGRSSAGPVMLLVGLILGAVGGYVLGTSMSKEGPQRGASTARMEELTGRPAAGGGGPPRGAGGPGGGARMGGGPGAGAARMGGGPPAGAPPGGSANASAPAVPTALAEVIVDLNAANAKKPLGFTQPQKDMLANNLRALAHISVVPDAQARADQITKMLTPEQAKAVEAAKASRKGEPTDAEYKAGINGVLTSIGANR